MMVEKVHTTPRSSLFPWLAPLVLSCEPVAGGVEVRLNQNNRQLPEWQPSRLRHVLPKWLITWMEEHSMHQCPQPYPLIRKLWEYLLPYASKKLIIDFSSLTDLQESRPPQNFALVWRLNRKLECIEGHVEGAEHYLGMGWFHTGTALWSLNTLPILPAVDACLRTPIVPLEQAGILLNTTVPQLEQHLLTRVDFRLIADCSFRVTAPLATRDELALSLTCNYPELLRTLTLPRQKADFLLARRAIVPFPQQAMLPTLIQLLQNKCSLVLRGTNIPLFIRDQLPLMRRYRLMSDEQAAAITRMYPIVSLDMLQPARTSIHMYEQGIGKYYLVDTYRYQDQVLDPDALLTAYKHGQRFVQQGDSWFEWPENPPAAFMRTLQQSRSTLPLQPEEVLGLTSPHLTVVGEPFPARSIQLDGTTSAKRARSLFQQLREHGIPGGILGSPPGLAKMFVDACERLLYENRQARILWLVPAPKKSTVTRAVNASSISSHVTVVSPANLHDEPTLTTHPWTLVIFQELDKLCDTGTQARKLSQFQWQWALLSLTSIHATKPALMHIVHLPQEHYEQFCDHFLFDVSKSQPAPSASRDLADSDEVQSLAIELNQQRIVKLHQESDLLQDRLIVEDEEPAMKPDLLQVHMTFTQPAPDPAPLPSISAPAQPDPQTSDTAEEEDTARVPAYAGRFAREVALVADKASSWRQRLAAATYQIVGILNLDMISKLRVEAASLPVGLVGQVGVSEPTYAETTGTSYKSTPMEPAPTLDEDWQTILQHWKPEHWEIILLLYRGQADQLPVVAHQAGRPLSRLIDEINAPVAEQLEDWLIEPETHTLASHFLATAGDLIQWHLSAHR
ncbi:MAG TPA: hypothetical protein VF458_13580 [Ktedonobacteraceae bacterium]